MSFTLFLWMMSESARRWQSDSQLSKYSTKRVLTVGVKSLLLCAVHGGALPDEGWLADRAYCEKCKIALPTAPEASNFLREHAEACGEIELHLA